MSVQRTFAVKVHWVVARRVLDGAILQPLRKSLLGPQRGLHLPVQLVPDLHQLGVLGLEVGDDLGVGLVAQPLVVVDDDVAVVLADERPTGGHRRLPGVGGVVSHKERP